MTISIGNCTLLPFGKAKASRILFGLTLLTALSAAQAQQSAASQTEASLSGVVTDQTGAALRDAAVTIKNVDAAATRTIPTDGEGPYQTSGLPPGRVEIR